MPPPRPPPPPLSPSSSPLLMAASTAVAAAAAAATASPPKDSPPLSSSSSHSAAASEGGHDRSPSPLPALPAEQLPSVSLAFPAPAASFSRRLPPPCWSHEDTLALIDAYRDKWLALRRGNLRAADWKEVAAAVAERCPSSSLLPKTDVQCRHKVEKLRKRFRAERLRSLSHDPSAPPSSTWPYFSKFDAMDRAGPSPPPASSSAAAHASASRHRAAPPSPPSSDSDSDDRRNTRSLHRLMSNSAANSTGLRFTIPKASRSKVTGSRHYDRHNHHPAALPQNPSPSPAIRLFKSYGSTWPEPEEMCRRLQKRQKMLMEGESYAAVGEMAAALRSLGDGFLRMEQMKMEMAREMEKMWMEMELKRTDMILDVQRRIVDAFVKGFAGGKKRAQMSPKD